MPEKSDEEELVLLGFLVDPETKRKLKIEAAKSGRTIKEIMASLVREYLAKQKMLEDGDPHRFRED